MPSSDLKCLHSRGLVVLRAASLFCSGLFMVVLEFVGAVGLLDNVQSFIDVGISCCNNLGVTPIE
jgi:hypothetical protein